MYTYIYIFFSCINSNVSCINNIEKIYKSLDQNFHYFHFLIMLINIKIIIIGNINFG